MKKDTLMKAGMILALIGTCGLANAGTEDTDTDAAKKKGARDGQRPSREEMLKKYDADGDGQLSDAERATMKADREAQQGGQKGQKGQRPSREEMTKKYDADGDGELSEEELNTMREEMGQRRGGRGGPGGERPSREEMIKKYDTDGDGQLSEEERKAARDAQGKKGKGNKSE